MPQLTTRRGWIRISPRPSGSASASPRISTPRTCHGSREATSSTTSDTFPVAATLRNLRVVDSDRPPTAIVSVSGSYRKPTGLFCGMPVGSTVASRPSGWVAR
jgi:hypothetical protein